MSEPDYGQPVHGSLERPSPEPFLVVGLGASAGGIEALRVFFAQVKPGSGAAYVVILHLSPEHESQLAAVLQKTTQLSVAQVTERVKVEPDHVYVVPPNRHLTMSDGEIEVSHNLSREERRAPIDLFLRTLAESHGEHAIAVILSGTGADGSSGVKRVKELGGAAFVQDPSEARFPDMPESAIATGFIDEVMPVTAIPAKIKAYGEALARIFIPETPEVRSAEQERALREIFTHLRVRTGQEFANYKRGTLLRRIERRMTVHLLRDLPSYATYLREHPEETQALLKDLLISVTMFFRDPAAFEVLEQEVLTGILARKDAETPVRVWVVGCATGEEAYSLAMILAERTLDVLDAPPVQIFATDLNEVALDRARAGLYTPNEIAEVPAERLRRFFTKEGENYRVHRELRRMVLFAKHDVLRNPPFSRLDLATCRNLLIYLNSTAQERVLRTLHFSLNPGGALFLGASESIDASSELFTPIDREARIYRSHEVGPRYLPSPEPIPDLQVDVAPSLPPRPEPLERMTYGELHQQLLERYAPPSVVINESYDIVHLSDRAGRYLRLSGGEPSRNLLDLIRPELRLELRSALYQAAQQRAHIEARNLRLSPREAVTLEVRPVLGPNDPARGFLLVLFKDVEATDDSAAGMVTTQPLAEGLEDELRHLKDQLRTTTQSYEEQAEELKASNEELQAMNEELRSAAEELETSKEELQSINEELTTVNQELKVKIEEATLTGDHLENLLNSSGIATLFLDRQFRVVFFSAAARSIFSLRASDVGRPLYEVSAKLEGSILPDAEQVLDDLRHVVREIGTIDGRTFTMRTQPYRSSDDQISGVVVNFFEITERERAETALRKSEEKYRTLFESIDEGFCIIEMLFDDAGEPLDYRFLETNPAFGRHPGRADVVGRTAREISAVNVELWIETYGQLAKDGGSIRFEHVEDAFTPPRYFDIYAVSVGPVTEHRIAISFRDISERRRSEEALRASEERMRLLLRATSEITYRMSPDWSVMLSLDGRGILQDVNEPNPEWLDAFIPTSDQEVVMATIEEKVRTRSIFELEHRVIGASGAIGWVFSRAVPIMGEGGEIKEWFGAAQDITDRRRAEADLALLAEIGESPPDVDSPEEAMCWLSEAVGKHFDAKICVLDFIGETAGQAVAPGVWQVAGTTAAQVDYLTGDLYSDSFVQACRADEPFLLPDATVSDDQIAHDLRELGLAALLCVPVLTDGEWRFNVTLADTVPRTWSEADVRLLREVGVRVWTRVERLLVTAALRQINVILELRVEERTAEWLKSQERFRQAFEVGPVAAAITSYDEDRVVEVNSAFCKLTGYEREELIGRTAAELRMWSTPADQAKIREALAEDRSGFRELDLTLTTKSGVIANILGSGGAIDFGGARCWLKMFVDTTERKRNQEELLAAIQEVMQDTAWFSRSVVERVADVRSGLQHAEVESVDLTPRERQVLGLVAQGKTDVEIARELGLSRQTIRNYVANLYGKLNVNSRAQAVVWARERGIME